MGLGKGVIASFEVAVPACVREQRVCRNVVMALCMCAFVTVMTPVFISCMSECNNVGAYVCMCVCMTVVIPVCMPCM